MKRFYDLLTPAFAIRLIAFSALALLAGAFAFQYLGGLAPCELCLRQRIPHWVAAGLGLVAILLLARGQQRRAVLFLVLMTGAMAVSAGLGLHHVGVEEGWWSYAGACTAATPTGSAADPFGTIFAVPLVRCDDPSWTLAGISMAGYNALCSAGLMLAGLIALIRPTQEQP
jgi:disulfide bond formation protein DsbB